MDFFFFQENFFVLFLNFLLKSMGLGNPLGKLLGLFNIVFVQVFFLYILCLFFADKISTEKTSARLLMHMNAPSDLLPMVFYHFFSWKLSNFFAFFQFCLWYDMLCLVRIMKKFFLIELQIVSCDGSHIKFELFLGDGIFFILLLF